MIPAHYVWLAWAGAFFLSWLALYAARPNLRRAMWAGSLLALPFGLSESLFLGRYWSPPTLFNLARVAHFDLETFLFCFAIGGVAAVLFNAVTGRPLRWRAKTEQDLALQLFHNVALAAPAPCFGLVLLMTGEPIWAAVAGFVGGIAGRLATRRDLWAKSLLGGPLFCGYYVLFLLLLEVAAPGYLGRTWNLHGPARVRFAGLPVTELLFAWSFGTYWSGLPEQIAWTMAWPRPAAALTTLRTEPASRTRRR